MELQLFQYRKEQGRLLMNGLLMVDPKQVLLDSAQGILKYMLPTEMDVFLLKKLLLINLIHQN